MGEIPGSLLSVAEFASLIDGRKRRSGYNDFLEIDYGCRAVAFIILHVDCIMTPIVVPIRVSLTIVRKLYPLPSSLASVRCSHLDGSREDALTVLTRVRNLVESQYRYRRHSQECLQHSAYVTLHSRTRAYLLASRQSSARPR